MNLNRTAAIATAAILTVGTLGVVPLGAGPATAHAAPLPAPEHTLGYQMRLDGRTVVMTLDSGGFRIGAGDRTVSIDDAAGRPVVRLPLAFRLDGTPYPLGHTVGDGGRTLTLTPPAGVRATGPLTVHTVASPAENSHAESYFAQQLEVATSAGGFIGTAIGAFVGWVTCGFVVIPVCVATIPSFAAVGTIIGAVVVGGPTFVAASVDLFQTLQARPGTTHWVNPNK